jgi:hypothetical protein
LFVVLRLLLDLMVVATLSHCVLSSIKYNSQKFNCIVFHSLVQLDSLLVFCKMTTVVAVASVVSRAASVLS